jgi:hypothetical protein
MELINALRPFPEAARAVATALHRLEAKSAASIKNESDRPLFEAKTIDHQPIANGKGEEI